MVIDHFSIIVTCFAIILSIAKFFNGVVYDSFTFVRQYDDMGKLWHDLSHCHML